MAQRFDTISAEHRALIDRQRVFFVATAPLAGAGHVNLSPKGLDCFRVLSEREVAYLDLTGSGNETAAHVAENGRITFLFCSFEGPPAILRLYGRGGVVLRGDARWAELAPGFPDLAGARQIVVAAIDLVQTSCGYGVPLFEHRGERDALVRWAEKHGPDGVAAYQARENARSLDGLPTPLATRAADGEGRT